MLSCEKKSAKNIPNCFSTRSCYVEKQSVWENHNFRPISYFVPEMIQDRVIVTGNAIRNSYVTYQSAIYNDLEWFPNIDFKVMIFLNVK